MKHEISPDNPFGYSPKGLALELVKVLSLRGRHLDYGTYNGAFVAALRQADLVDSALGIDVNAEVVERHQKSMPAGVELRTIIKNEPLKLPRESFASISVLGVLEHVHNQKRLLSQLADLLAPNGRILIAVPGRHLFSWLDMGNFKFLFPRIHRHVFTARHGKEAYTVRYVECRNGLFGDIEVEKMWHEHFSPQSMAEVLSEVGLVVDEVDGLGLFRRLLTNAAYLTRSRRGWLQRMIDYDARTFGRAELVFVVRRCTDGPGTDVRGLARGAGDA